MNQQDHTDPLRALEREIAPPPALEARVRRTLHERGLLHRPRYSAVWRMAGWAAAAVVLFAAGFLTSRLSGVAGAAQAEGRRYVLLLYQDSTFAATRSEAEMVAEYGAWAQRLRQGGTFELGEKLADAATTLSTDAGSVLVETGGASDRAVAGFFVIRADSDAEAVAVAATCPHLRYGGRITVRAIEETG